MQFSSHHIDKNCRIVSSKSFTRHGPHHGAQNSTIRKGVPIVKTYLEHLSNTLQTEVIAPKKKKKNTDLLEQSLNSFAVVKLQNYKNLTSTIGMK